MQPITNLISDVTQQSSVSVANVKEQSKVQQQEEERQEHILEPAIDRYVREEKEEPIGRYWLDKDEKGKLKICFDAPEQSEANSQKAEGTQNARNLVKNETEKGLNKKDAEDEKCTCNTDKVDREIEKLKKKKSELEQQINSETDDRRLKNFENKLAQVERELNQKDNDTYRRQHATYTYN